MDRILYLNNMRTVHANERITPPEDMNYPMCDCCCEPIFNDLYKVNDMLYCEDCAKSLHRMWVLDDPVECSGCEEEITDEYYQVSNDCYCEECFQKYFKE